VSRRLPRADIGGPFFDAVNGQGKPDRRELITELPDLFRLHLCPSLPHTDNASNAQWPVDLLQRRHSGHTRFITIDPREYVRMIGDMANFSDKMIGGANGRRIQITAARCTALFSKGDDDPGLHMMEAFRLYILDDRLTPALPFFFSQAEEKPNKWPHPPPKVPPAPPPLPRPPKKKKKIFGVLGPQKFLDHGGPKS